MQEWMIVLAVLSGVLVTVGYMVTRALSMETGGYGAGGYGKLGEGDRQAKWLAEQQNK
ncbi:MAG: hypothetical protein OEY97_02975 [Nitrospirota bacterium]|nr:hypothetical protein [Nitrospirota bacterium]